MTGATFHVGDPDAPEPNRPRRIGACIVLLDDTGGSVLLEHRADSDLWGLIGGGIDDRESIIAGLHREVVEETGLGLTECALLGLWSDPTRILAYPDGNVMRSVTAGFIGRLVPGVPIVSDESRGLAWYGWEAIPWDQVPPTQRGILRRGREWEQLGVRTPYVD
ncbi:NUDIX domain-containing protein [Microlunatus sp. Y2014]|uniref:NUDIX domain-containing protein n=1 Tax=Microlunatus sp. Y2014 TaxID=3418488 RepID=UPI003DA77372